MKKNVTLNDIAKACGTSNVTVSKALANKGGVSDELRARIFAVADEMGYIYSKSSYNKKSFNIGVIIPQKFINPNGSYYWALYNCLVQKCKKENMFCILENLESDDEKKLVMPHFVTDGKVAAVVSLGQISREYAVALKESVPALLMLDYYISDVDADSVVTNGYAGGYTLTKHLYEMGHEKIGFIGTKLATTSIFDRYMGYIKAMIENNLEIKKEWTLDDRENGGYIRVSFPEEMPTAFVCNCDEVAYNTIKQLRETGYNVPEDISVVGYDNYLISEISQPTITTINVDADLMASAAVEALLERINDPAGKKRCRYIEGELVKKESVCSVKK